MLVVVAHRRQQFGNVVVVEAIEGVAADAAHRNHAGLTQKSQLVRSPALGQSSGLSEVFH